MTARLLHWHVAADEREAGFPCRSGSYSDMELGEFIRARAPRLALGAAIPLVAVLVALATSDDGGYRATARVAVPAASLDGDPLVSAENFRALVQTRPVVATVAAALGVAPKALRKRISARQIGRGSVVEVIYEGGGAASTARRATVMAIVEGLRATYSAELSDADPLVTARARSRLDVVADAARRGVMTRRSDARGRAMSTAAAIGMVLAGGGLVVAERAGDRPS